MNQKPFTKCMMVIIRSWTNGNEGKRVMASYTRWMMCCALLVALILSACGSDDQGAEKSFVVGIINPNPYSMEIVQGFKDEMTARDRVEGKTVTYIEGVSSQAVTEKTPANK